VIDKRLLFFAHPEIATERSRFFKDIHQALIQIRSFGFGTIDIAGSRKKEVNRIAEKRDRPDCKGRN
jgi:hypothetical protein